MRADTNLPPGWVRTTLGAVAQVRTGLALGRSAGDEPVTLPYLRVANVQDGYLDLEEVKQVTISKAEVGRYSLADGDLLLTEGGDFDKLGRGCIWRGEVANCLHQNHVFAVRADRTRVDPNFLACATASRAGRQYFLDCAKKSTNLASINSTQLKGMPLQLPPLDAQVGICKRVAVWDHGIGVLKKQIDLAARLKVGLLSSLMRGTTRLKSFEGNRWSSTRFGSFLTESREVGTNGATAKKLRVRLYGRGVVPKSDTRPGSAATQYFRRRAGQLIYSKLDFLNGAFGIIPAGLNGYESTLDLPAFDISDSIDPRWLLYYVTREGFYLGQLGLAYGGRKARRVNPKDFLEVEIRIPDKPEQSAIADVLQAADRQVSLLEQRLGLVLKQKQVLIDELLACPHGASEEAA